MVDCCREELGVVVRLLLPLPGDVQELSHLFPGVPFVDDSPFSPLLMFFGKEFTCKFETSVVIFREPLSTLSLIAGENPPGDIEEEREFFSIPFLRINT